MRVSRNRRRREVVSRKFSFGKIVAASVVEIRTHTLTVAWLSMPSRVISGSCSATRPVAVRIRLVRAATGRHSIGNARMRQSRTRLRRRATNVVVLIAVFIRQAPPSAVFVLCRIVVIIVAADGDMWFVASVPKVRTSDILDNSTDGGSGELAPLDKRGVARIHGRALAGCFLQPVYRAKQGIAEVGKRVILVWLVKIVVTVVGIGRMRHMAYPVLLVVVHMVIFMHRRVRPHIIVAYGFHADSLIVLHLFPQPLRHAVVPSLHDRVGRLGETRSRQNLGKGLVDGATGNADIPFDEGFAQEFCMFVRRE